MTDHPLQICHHIYMCCDINFEGTGLKFVGGIAQLFLNRFACSAAQNIQKIRGYSINKLLMQILQNTRKLTRDMPYSQHRDEG